MSAFFKRMFQRGGASDSTGEENKNYETLAVKFTEAFGGKENIISIDYCVTRLRLAIRDFGFVDERELKKLGGKGFSKIGPKNLQVTVGKDAETLADAMKKYHKK